MKNKIKLDGNTFLYTRHLNLYLVAVTRGNVNPAMVFEFLYQKIRIFKAYFKRDFDEDTLRNNMTLILELMDGESGYPCVCVFCVFEGGTPSSLFETTI